MLNPDSADILIHIGYHKTASTWLQHQVFEQPQTGFLRALKKGQIKDQIVQPHSLQFEAEQAREFYKQLEAEQSKSQISVVSSERLSGNPHSGGYDSKEIATRLKAVFPKAKVLIAIREQVSAIASCYLQYVKFGGPCSLASYLEPVARGSQTVPGFSFGHFDYHKLISYYIELFGRDSVLVLPYEIFRTSPQDFCDRITDFAGAQKLSELPYNKVTNKRISTFSAKFARRLNTVFSKTAFNPGALDLPMIREGMYVPILALDALIPKSMHKIFDKKNKEYIQNLAGDRYAEGNRKLSEELGIELSQYGYNT